MTDIIDIKTRNSVKPSTNDETKPEDYSEHQLQVISDLEELLSLVKSDKVRSLAIMGINKDNQALPYKVSMDSIDDVFRLSAILDVTMEQLKEYRDLALMGVPKEDE